MTTEERVRLFQAGNPGDLRSWSVLIRLPPFPVDSQSTALPARSALRSWRESRGLARINLGYITMREVEPRTMRPRSPLPSSQREVKKMIVEAAQ